MALKFDGWSITVSGTREVTWPAEIGSMISPSEWVSVPLNMTKNLHGLHKLSGL